LPTPPRSRPSSTSSPRAAEKGGPLALRLPRAPGAREPRWTHLLAGAVDVSMLPAAAPDEIVASSEIAALKARQDVLQREVDELRALVERLHAELGIAKP
jgi:uncharacterized protein YceH (UPF0502 family)